MDSACQFRFIKDNGATINNFGGISYICIRSFVSVHLYPFICIRSSVSVHLYLFYASLLGAVMC